MQIIKIIFNLFFTVIQYLYYIISILISNIKFFARKKYNKKQNSTLTCPKTEVMQYIFHLVYIMYYMTSLCIT